ncbi:hypothetical protein LPJ71_011669, partial [Coemansia sp. S17]
ATRLTHIIQSLYMCVATSMKRPSRLAASVASSCESLARTYKFGWCVLTSGFAGRLSKSYFLARSVPTRWEK